MVASLVLGLVVGLPYYSLPYFYDYFERAFGWSRAAVMLGLPVGTLVTLIIGPLFVRHLPPRRCIVAGSAACALSLVGFGLMGGNLWLYYGLWMLYMVGWTFAGPLSHQILIAQVFVQNRSPALAVAYFGISAIGALSVAALARPLTQAFGFHTALIVLGTLVLSAMPIAHWFLPDVHAESSPARALTEEPAVEWQRHRAFWVLIIGSTLSVAGIGGLSQHFKLVLAESGHWDQAGLDAVFGWTLMGMLVAGATGRFAVAWAVERFPTAPISRVALLLMAVAMPLLLLMPAYPLPYLFAICFGLGMSTDSMIVPHLAGNTFGELTTGRVMGIIVPVNTVGQTWFPYVVSLLWASSGSYTLPLVVTFGLILAGRLTLALLPEPGSGRSGLHTPGPPPELARDSTSTVDAAGLRRGR